MTSRVDLYRFIHKAIRLSLCESLVAVGQADPSQAQAFGSVLDRVRDLVQLLQAHRQAEEAFLHPALEARVPGSTGAATEDHHAHGADLVAVSDLVAAIHSAGDIEERRTLAARLYDRIAAMMAMQLIHMQHEEVEHNAVFWTHYSDAEMLQIRQRLLASLEPRARQRDAVLMLRALSPSERVALLSGMRESLDAVSFQRVSCELFAALSPFEQRQLAVSLSVLGDSRTLAA